MRPPIQPRTANPKTNTTVSMIQSRFMLASCLRLAGQLLGGRGDLLDGIPAPAPAIDSAAKDVNVLERSSRGQVAGRADTRGLVRLRAIENDLVLARELTRIEVVRADQPGVGDPHGSGGEIQRRPEIDHDDGRADVETLLEL